MFARILTPALIVLTLLMSGCATQQEMAFKQGADVKAQMVKPILLMSVTLRNVYRTSHQPELIVANVERVPSKDSADRLNFRKDDESVDAVGEAEKGNTYLIRMPLEAGEYVIRGFTSISSSFPIHGFFFAPLHAKVASTRPGIIYLGHVDATVRERKDNEFKAGPSIPLIDQAIAGASGGTFDVVISDQWATDEAKFRNKFPALSGVAIERAILAPFDRNVAQKWWEEH